MFRGLNACQFQCPAHYWPKIRSLKHVRKFKRLPIIMSKRRTTMIIKNSDFERIHTEKYWYSQSILVHELRFLALHKTSLKVDFL